VRLISSFDFNSLKSLASHFMYCQRGATAIEYAMMAAGIALAVITAVEATGTNVREAFFDEIAKATAP
jgi:pilus assembly protein Flp/PilA